MSSRSSVNMLRTRRRDNNVKPNRREFRAGRLDRKSSRGMIYENEELRLRTININAEIERGQYDIKKLKRENELLKKEIWCLRDEYEKLDKLLKDKDINLSSSSTTSESDSCSSCLDESDEIEKNQNLENVHKTNIKNLTRNFESLSVVPEESTENSDKTSNRTSLINEQLPNDNEIIQADQNYPCYEQTSTLRIGEGKQNTSKNFFSLERLNSETTSKSYREPPTIYPNDYYTDNPKVIFRSDDSPSPYCINSTNIYQNVALTQDQKNYTESESLQKGSTDILVKIDNKNFDLNQERDGVSNCHFDDCYSRFPSNFGRSSHSTFSNGGNLEELLNDIETISQDILAISTSNQNDYFNTTRRCKSDINPTDKELTDSINEKPFKSELNVTLMPQPMALIGLEKYRDIQRSMNTTPSKSLENLSNEGSHIFQNQDNNPLDKRDYDLFHDVSDFVPIHPSQMSNIIDTSSPRITQQNFSPYLTNINDNFVNGDYFARYNPENHQMKMKEKKLNEDQEKDASKVTAISDINLGDTEENGKTKIKQNNEIINESKDSKFESKEKIDARKKVSIHFPGRKEKQKKILEAALNTIKKSSPIRDKKLQEIKIEEKCDKTKINHQKTSSKDSNKTIPEPDTKNNPELKKLTEKYDDKKIRKSPSISPDRKKIKEDKKCKKHKKDKLKRRATVTSLESRDQRGRSHSVNTERSNTFGGSNLFFDEYMLNSERESMSSCETMKRQQMNFSSVPINGKVPWCGCWGNGCI